MIDEYDIDENFDDEEEAELHNVGGGESESSGSEQEESPPGNNDTRSNENGGDSSANSTHSHGNVHGNVEENIEGNGGNSNEMEGSASSSSSSASSSSNKGKGVMSYPIEDFIPPNLSSKHDLKNTYQWTSLLSEPDFLAAPVASFKHAPMADCWDNILVGMKVEVENQDSDTVPNVFSHAFWVATVFRISGYHARLRFEGFGQDGSKDFWISLCSDKVHPVGWCATKGKPLIPPRSIQTKYADWKEFLVKRLTGARTLPSNFYCKVWESVSSNFKPGMKLEVVDKMRICQVRVATIIEVTGRRLYLTYDDVDHDDRGFWCHEESPLIHPVGWARRVGHQIVASQEYYDRCTMENFLETDCTADMFPEYRPPPGNFVVGMKLEAVDPLNLATICVASVMKVLRFGYIMIRMDGYETDATGSDWFCYHGSSPLIFPPGYCEKHNIELKMLPNSDQKFTWFEYLKETNATAAPISLFHRNRDDVKHGFKVGMKLECADQMDPRLICVSTINKVVGRLLKVHFDGWDSEYDQWMDCEAVDIYPVGWADVVGHKLEGPRMSPVAPKEKKRKPVGRKGGGRKRTSNSAGGGNGAGSSSSNPSPVNNSNGGGSSVRKARKLASSVSPTNQESTPTPTPTVTPPPPAQPSTPPPPVLSVPPTVQNETKEDNESELLETEATANADNNTSASSTTPLVKVIPRLVDSTGQAAIQRSRDSNLDPNSWTVEEVAQFLEINECASLVDAFTEKRVDGSQFLNLAKEDIMKLVNNKFGPCLKVENLLRLLRARLNPAHARFEATMRKSSL